MEFVVFLVCFPFISPQKKGARCSVSLPGREWQVGAEVTYKSLSSQASVSQKSDLIGARMLNAFNLVVGGQQEGFCEF